MKTLTDILQAPRFSDLTLLTKGVATEVIITSVEITETPDIANFTSTDTLLLTTAMYYKNRQYELKELINSLTKVGVAGLVIKLGRFIDEVDEDVIRYAQKKNFPLLSIPGTKPLGAEMQKLSSFINNTKTEQISYALDIQKQFSNLIINDAPLDKIITELGNILCCPVLLLNPFKEVLAHSKDFEQIKITDSSLIEQLMDLNSFKQKSTTRFVQMDAQTKVEVAIFPIKSNNYFPYYLVVLSPEKIPYPVSEFTIEQALLILSFVLLKNEKIEASQKQIKSDYFYNLVERQEHKITDTKRWMAYDIHFGIRFSHFYQIIYVSLKNEGEHAHYVKLNEEKMNLAYLWLNDKLSEYFEDAVIFPEKNSHNLVILLQNKVDLDKVGETLGIVNQLLLQRLPIEIVFSCGQACENFDKISTSLVEAKLMFEERRSKDIDDLFIAYRPKGILNLFDNLHDDEIKYFCEHILKELAYPVDPMYQELRKTLKTFLDNQCEITKTANTLFVHRNTVKYRIDNCESILGMKVNVPKNSLNLRLALELSEDRT